jgi:hypothetical protein
VKFDLFVSLSFEAPFTLQGQRRMSVSAEEKKDAPLATKTVQADGDAQEGILEMWSLAKLTGLDKLLWGGLSRLAPSLGMEPETLVMGVQQFAESSTSLAAADTEKLHQLDQKLIETHAVLKNVVEQCEPRFKSLEASKVSLGQRLTKLELANSDAERKAEIAALGERLVKLEQGKTKTQRKVEVESGLEDLREEYVLCMFPRSRIPCCFRCCFA